MAASENANGSTLKKLTITLILSAGLAACGGGGGSSGSGEDRGVGAVEALPAFLEDKASDCYFFDSENFDPENEVRVTDFQGALSTVTKLSCDRGMEFDNFNGIEKLSGLVSLELVYSNIRDFSGLTPALSELKIITINASGVDEEDLSFIGQISTLEVLKLSRNSIGSVAALSGLQRLKRLDLSHNRIGDLTPLYALTGLDELDLTGERNGLACIDVLDLAFALETVETGNIVIPPSRCANIIELGDGSPELSTIDNSLEDPAYDRLLIRGELGDLQLHKSEYDLSLILTTGEGEKNLTFSDWFRSVIYRVGRFEFSDGTVYSFHDLRDELPLHETLSDEADRYETTDDNVVVYANGGDDYLLGANRVEFFGGEGDDILIGDSGSDVLAGGPGDDILIGGWGSVSEDGTITLDSDDLSNRAILDTYVFNLGDGNDLVIDYGFRTNHGTLRFGEGIIPEMVSLRIDGDHLVFVINEYDSVTVYKWYRSTTYRLDFIEFSGLAPLDASDFVSGLM